MKSIILRKAILIQLTIFLTGGYSFAGEYPKTLNMNYGSTPVLDGYISQGEYDDAEKLTGVSNWESDTKQPSQEESDLSVKLWMKHDGKNLYFAFDVRDDVLYGIDIDRWVHSNNNTPHKMDYEGWPWFGDGMEIMMNSSYEWDGATECAGDAKSWQVVFSTHKSLDNGLDKGGLMLGEPRNDYAWGNYRKWIEDSSIQTAFRLKPESEGRGYVVEWKIAPNPCMKNSDGAYIDLNKKNKIGINFEFQDLDEKEKGDGNWSNMHHIDFLAKVGSYRKTALTSYATLEITPGSISPTAISSNHSPDNFKLTNYPNPFSSYTNIVYTLPKTAKTYIIIINQLGQEVKTLVNKIQEPGMYQIQWNGLDNNGNDVPNGIYMYYLYSGNSCEVKRLILIR